MVKYAKWINDNIHGPIGLTEKELALVDTPVFQRLRRIRQLSLVHLVFPTAEHSRFVHSLGVLALANKIAHQLMEIENGFGEEALHIARLTALLHDIGHLPWSHLGEQAYEAYLFDREGGGLDLEAKTQDTSNHLLNRLANYSPAKKIHEQIGAYLIRQHPQLKRHLGSDEAEVVASILEKSDLVQQNKTLQLVRSIISSALDADRLDYLIRDSQSTGVRYGLVDADFLIRNIRVGEYEGQKLLCVREEALVAVEHFLFSRLFHYMQVVYHKNVTTFEAVARALMYRMIQKGFLYNRFNKLEDMYEFALSEQWYNFDDKHVFGLAREFANDVKTDDLDRALAGAIIDRKRPIIVCEMRGVFTKGTGPEQYYNLRNLVASSPEEIAELLGVPAKFVSYTESSVRIDSIYESKYGGLDLLIDEEDRERLIHEAADALKLIDNNGKWRLAVSSVDSFLHLVANHERRTLRVFCLDSDSHPVDPKRLEFARNNIKKRFPDAIVKAETGSE